MFFYTEESKVSLLHERATVLKPIRFCTRRTNAATIQGKDAQL
jgi:hypothetical protein